jgi:cyclic pyranopterin phosphate synthase
MPVTGGTAASSGEMLSDLEIVAFVRHLKEFHGLTHVRLTGGEPLLRPDICKLIQMIAAQGVDDIALTTNGQQLAGVAGQLKQAGLGRINVSLDSVDPKTFSAVTRGGSLQKTIAGIDAAQDVGLRPIKLNTVVIRGRNDHEVAALVRFAIDRNCEARFLELMPIGIAADQFEEQHVSSAEVRETISRKFKLAAAPVDPYSTSRNYVARDEFGRSTTVGFVSPFSEPFCLGCWRLRLTVTGTLMGCLGRPGGISIAPLLRAHSEVDSPALSAAVEQALAMKRRDSEFFQPEVMVGIGG